MWFNRRVGPPPPNLISRAFTAMLNRAPLREWTRLGAGIAAVFLTLVVLAAARFGWPAGTEEKRLDIIMVLAVMAGLAVLVAMVSTFDINLKFKADKTGISGDFSPEEEEPISAHVEGDVKITPEAGK